MNISGPAAVAKPEMLFYAPGDLTVTDGQPAFCVVERKQQPRGIRRGAAVTAISGCDSIVHQRHGSVWL